MAAGAPGRLRLWLVFWLPGALLLLLGLLVIPNPTGRWAWTYGSVGSRTPLLKTGLTVGQPIPAPGRPFSYVGVRFHLQGAKTESKVEVRLLRGASPPRDHKELTARTLARREQGHKMLRGDRFFRLEAPGQSGQEPLFLTARLLKQQAEPKIKLWLDKSPHWQGKVARLFKAPASRALDGHLTLELGDPGEDEPLFWALAGRWWGVLFLLLLLAGSFALLVWLTPDPVGFRQSLSRGRLALRKARPTWPGLQRRGWLPAVLLVCLVHVVLMLQLAWLSDDIYITLRSVVSLAAGDGPIWNPGERVQAYTHPLWMALLTVGYLLCGSTFAATLGLGLLCSLLTLYLVVFRVARGALPAFLAVALLSVSMAYMDFSTSGLENPLLHLLLALFTLNYLHHEEAGGRGAVFRLWLIFCLALLTRLDAALLFMPALAWLTWRQLRSSDLGHGAWFKTAALALLPLAAWLAFALFYYGTPLPNTAYAKMNTGIHKFQLITQGGMFLLNSLAWDPATLVIIVASAVVPLATGERRLWPLVAGAWLYVLYTVWIGGCFMSGRFLTGPLLLSVLLWSRLSLTRLGPALTPAMLLLAMSLGTRFGVPGVVGGQASPRFGNNGVADERAFYFNERSLMSVSRDIDKADTPESTASVPMSTSGCGGAGMMAFLRGGEAYVLDACALGDAFLSRLPARGAHTTRWRIGHFLRVVPGGYTQTLTTRQNLITSRELSAYYERVRAVIAWDMLDSKRLKLLWSRLWGSDDHLLAKVHPSEWTLTELSRKHPPTDGEDAPPRPLRMGEGGVKIDLEERRFNHAVQFKVNADARYRLYFIRNNRFKGYKEFGPTKGKELTSYRVRVPTEAATGGYDRLYLLPVQGRRRYLLDVFTLY